MCPSCHPQMGQHYNGTDLVIPCTKARLHFFPLLPMIHGEKQIFRIVYKETVDTVNLPGGGLSVLR